MINFISTYLFIGLCFATIYCIDYVDKCKTVDPKIETISSLTVFWGPVLIAVLYHNMIDDGETNKSYSCELE